MGNWLQNRLSPVKIDTDRWSEIGAAIEQFWEENFDPDLAWIVSLRSIYETDLRGQLLIQAAKGEYFEDHIPTENIPLAVQQKELELCQKGSQFPLENSLKRLELTADWISLYASRVNQYGTDFVFDGHVPEGWRLDGSWTVSDDGDALLRAGYFLTSRGVLYVELGDDSIANEIALIRNRVDQTRPVWIVFDGFVYHVGNELNQPHDISTEGHITAETKLSGWSCGLKLDGTWGLGRAIRLDGNWCLNRGWRVGQIWPRGIIVNKLNSTRALDGTWQLSMVLLPHLKITDCRLDVEGVFRGECDVTPWRSANYFQVATDSPVPLDGDYQLGRVYDRWPPVESEAESSFDRDVYFGGEADALPGDVVYCGPLPERCYFGGTADELPENVVFGGSIELLPYVFGGDATELPDDVIFDSSIGSLFSYVFNGGNTTGERIEPLPFHTIYGAPVLEVEDVIFAESLFLCLYLGGTALSLPENIVFSGNAQHQAVDVIDYSGLLGHDVCYFGGTPDILPKHVVCGGLNDSIPSTLIFQEYDVVEYGLLPIRWYFGGSANVLPDDCIYGGSTDPLLTSIIMPIMGGF